MDKKQFFQVTQEEDGLRIERFISKKLNIHFHNASLLLRKRRIKLDGKKISKTVKVINGNNIEVMFIDEVSDKRSNGVNIKSPIYLKTKKNVLDSIILISDNLIVLNKPANIPVQGGNKISISIDDLCEDMKFNLDYKPRLVHRLDKGTTGVLLLARNIFFTRLLARAFHNQSIKKKYIAILNGIPQKKYGQIETKLSKSYISESFEKIVSSEDYGKESITKYKVIAKSLEHNMSFVEFDIETGRTHQIRVHSNEIGCSILGDTKYNEFKSKKNHKNFDEIDIKEMPNRKNDPHHKPNLYLHSYSLSIPLSAFQRDEFIDIIDDINIKQGDMIIDDSSITFVANIPEYFQEKLKEIFKSSFNKDLLD